MSANFTPLSSSIILMNASEYSPRGVKRLPPISSFHSPFRYCTMMEEFALATAATTQCAAKFYSLANRDCQIESRRIGFVGLSKVLPLRWIPQVHAWVVILQPSIQIFGKNLSTSRERDVRVPQPVARNNI